jgi:hypothetical protein
VPAQPIIPGAGSYGGGASGSGFEYDEATLHELVKEWRTLAGEFRTDIAHAEVIARTQGPGLEYASDGNAELVRASGQSLSETLEQRARYCEAMADRYATALGKYATAEEVHATEVGNTTKGTI